MIKKLFKIRLKKGDMVIVRIGKDKGKTGKITAVHPQENKVTVEGINIIKKHIKSNKAYPQGTILQITKPIFVSKVGILDPESKKASRISYKLSNDNKEKVRIYRSSSKEIK